MASIATGIWTATHEPIGFAVSVVSLTSFVVNSDNSFWSFLVRAIFPMAVGSLLLVEAGNFGSRSRADRLSHSALFTNIIVVIAGIVTGVWEVTQSQSAIS